MSVLESGTTSAYGGIFDGFDAVILAAGELEAVFVPHLGMVGASLRHRGEELLDRRHGLRAYRDTGAVMGLPLLHPWANRLAGDTYTLHGRTTRLPAGPPLVRRDENGLPIHGLLAAHPGWRVASVDAGPGGARLEATLDFGADPALLAAFPFRHEITIVATLTAAALRIATTVTATGGAPVPIAFGFHPYLRLPGADRREWEVSLPAARHLTLDPRGIPTGTTAHAAPRTFALARRGFDDAFDSIAAGAAFAMTGGGRTIRLTHEHGYPVAQVYSPPGAPFVCFEPMTAPVDALRTGAELRRAVAGRPYTAVFSISVRPA